MMVGLKLRTLRRNADDVFFGYPLCEVFVNDKVL